MEKPLDARIIDDYLVKKPFMRITPDYFGGFNGSYVSDGEYRTPDKDVITGKLMTQADFLREYFVTGHKINSETYYPNIWKKDEHNRDVVELVSRAAFPFQQVISTKQIIHLTGNLIKIEDSTTEPTEENKRTLMFYRQGWKDKNMEIAFFEFVQSVKNTGDGAICFFYNKGKIGWRVFSFTEGDTLYMHYDQITGDKKLFIRTYSMYDENNREVKEFAEAWDNKYMYRFEKAKAGLKGAKNSAKSLLGISGWKLIDSGVHGFSTMPISYHRERDVCWADSQNSIDMYEMAVSQLCENNKAYAFPILFVKGGDLDFRGQVNGRPYAIVSSDNESDAKTLNRADASTSFELQLNILLKNIFTGSFAVLPPEVKAGDLPGVAIKLLYSPAVEKAMRDAKVFDHVIDDMIQLFREGYAVETKQSSAFSRLRVHGTIEPYVHQNVAEIMQNLFEGVTGGFVSRETASQVSPYSKNDEYKRLLNQTREEIIGLKNQQNGNSEITGN